MSVQAVALGSIECLRERDTVTYGHWSYCHGGHSVILTTAFIEDFLQKYWTLYFVQYIKFLILLWISTYLTVDFYWFREDFYKFKDAYFMTSLWVS